MLEINYVCKIFHNWVFTTPLHHFYFVLSTFIMNTIKDQNHGCYYKNRPKAFVCFNYPPTFVTKVKIFTYLKFHFFGIIFIYNLFNVWSYSEIQWDINYRVSYLSFHGITLWCVFMALYSIKTYFIHVYARNLQIIHFMSNNHLYNHHHWGMWTKHHTLHFYSERKLPLFPPWGVESHEHHWS